MPELPDVEVFKQYFDATALHKKIETVEIEHRKILESGVTEDALNTALTGRAFDSTMRHGKYLFAATDNQQVLVLHFGMTGFLRYCKEGNQDAGHVRMRVHFSNGYQLAFDNQRLLGRAGLTESIDDYIGHKDLGPDAAAVNLDAFREILSKGRGSLKSTLMNQNLIAGIGNVYSDEMLYQAGIHPKADVRKLSDEQIKKLYTTMKHVFKTAIQAKAEPQELPSSWILPRRGEKDAACPECSGTIETMKVSGRTTYFCPNCQKNN